MRLPRVETDQSWLGDVLTVVPAGAPARWTPLSTGAKVMACVGARSLH
jgi:hypothetical protein